MRFRMGQDDEGRRREFDLTREQVEVRMSNVPAEPIRTHAVVVNGAAYPPKQVIEVCLGFPRLSYTTFEAQRVLSRLGFPSKEPVAKLDPQRWFDENRVASANTGPIAFVSPDAEMGPVPFFGGPGADSAPLPPGVVSEGDIAGLDGEPPETSLPPASRVRFVTVARRAAAEWHATSVSLKEECRVSGTYRGGGPYPFCLPVSCSLDNLLPEARSIALERFRAADIAWHDGIKGGPSNHLLSSQVQCVNALAPFVADPDALKAVFSPVLPIETVLPFGSASTSPFDLTDHVVFEWAGLADYLGEHPGGPGLRGAMNTSVDAAIRYRALDGRIEIGLIEWKYVEQYRGHQLSGGATSTEVRKKRYRPLWDDPDGPLRHDLVPYEDLFFEPMYQLMRQQMLAWQMERARELDADLVRLVVVAPSANYELAVSFNSPGQRTLGEGVEFDPDDLTVHTVWKAMQRRPDRFVFLDSATLVSANSPTSYEFKQRYGHLAASGSGETPASASAATASLPGDGEVERLRRALERALVVLRRVVGEGGVLDQVALLEDDALRRADAQLLIETSSRLEELAELGRRIRADEISHLLGSVRQQ